MTGGNLLALAPTRPRIMLVDDEVQQLQMHACIITSCGYEVITAPDPFLAIHLAANEALNLAVLDYEMPGMNGYMLADKLRETTPALKIALCSGVVALPRKRLMESRRVHFEGRWYLRDPPPSHIRSSKAGSLIHNTLVQVAMAIVNQFSCIAIGLARSLHSLCYAGFFQDLGARSRSAKCLYAATTKRIVSASTCGGITVTNIWQ